MAKKERVEVVDVSEDILISDVVGKFPAPEVPMYFCVGCNTLFEGGVNLPFTVCDCGKSDIRPVLAIDDPVELPEGADLG